MRNLASREINEAHGVGAFLKRWLGAAPAIGDDGDAPRRASTGNINLDATIGSSPSALLAPGDARFTDFIEPAVAPLVLATVAAGWISYTSCEGHLYPGGNADELHVGLIARNATERAEIERIWSVAGQAWDQAYPARSVEFALMRGTVHCDGRIDLPTTDLYLCRRDARGWDEYFIDRGDAVQFAVGFLSRNDS
jgi:hypothetical protein